MAEGSLIATGVPAILVPEYEATRLSRAKQ